MNFLTMDSPPKSTIRRIWSTALMRCEVCNDFKAALWVDRWELVGGYYCDTCHRDHKRISYLLKELNRKPRDAIISDRSCYLLDNPDFQSFPLFEPGRIAYLGASMGLGKTTAIFDSLAHHEPGTASIVLGPRISLIQALASIYRYTSMDGTLGDYFMKEVESVIAISANMVQSVVCLHCPLFSDRLKNNRISSGF